MTRDIVVNGRFLSRPITGVERYGREITKLIVSGCQLEKPVLRVVETTRFNGLAGHAWEQLILPTKLNSEAILWSPANTGPLLVRNQALTIHDLSPFEHPEWFKKSFALWYRLFLPILAKRVRVIFTPSEYVKRKVMKQFGIKYVIITPNGVNAAIFHPAAEQHKHELPKSYVLFVGSIEPRKNLRVLLQAWQELKNDFKDTWLVIAGTSGRVFQPVKLLRDMERVRFLGYVEEDDLPGIYTGATLFVLPSFEEGFGLPVLEAMACGTPVLVSNGGALPETVGDAGFIFDLSKPDMLVTALRNILCDDTLRLSLREKALTRAKTFSWQYTAELIWNTLNEI